MALNRGPLLTVLVLVAVAAGACGESTEMGRERTIGDGQSARGPEPLEALRKEFEGYVETVNSCVSDSECTVIFPGCPLGCFVAVPEARRTEIEAKAQSMLTAFGGGRTVCGYNCAASSPASCTDRRCTSKPVPGPNNQR
jgi:hypothetical protein